MIQLNAETVGLFYETSHYKDIYFKKNAYQQATAQMTPPYERPQK